MAFTLLKHAPDWKLPEGNNTWALEELHEALDATAPELGDEMVVGYVVRDCWCLVYEEGKVVMQDFVHALVRHGFIVIEDEIQGVRDALEEVRETYKPHWVF